MSVLFSSRTFLLLPLIVLSLLTASCSDDDDEGPARPEMLLIPAGSFTMGDERGIFEANERPSRTVSLDAFYMSKTEITQAQYQDIIGANPSSSMASAQPVEKVTWYDALRFCNALSKSEGLEPVYSDIDGNLSADFSANGYRLPTEAEWEYACRAGTTTRYYTGESVGDLGRCAWFSGNADGHPRNAGQLEANTFGLQDMHGNVFEWCWDWYGANYYGQAENTNPRGPEGGEEKVCRGGSWFVYEYGCRASFRSMLEPDLSGIDIGFRVVRRAE